MNQAVFEKIRQRRLQMLVHSYIYYELNDNIITDATWSRWAKELQKLQTKYPKTSKKAPYHEQFKNWDGSSGAFLDFDDKTIQVAHCLLEMRDSKKQKKVHKLPVKPKTKKKKLF